MGAVCYRTYENSQSNIGCLSTSKLAEMCCQLQIDPYKDWTFQAVQIEQPDSILVLRYRIYEHISSGGEIIGIRPSTNTKKWKKTSDEEIEIPINNGVAPVELNKEHKMQILAGLILF